MEDLEKDLQYPIESAAASAATVTPEHGEPSPIPKKPKRTAPVSDVPPTPKRANIEEVGLIDKEELPKPTVEVQVVNLLLNEGPGDGVLKPTLASWALAIKVSWRHFKKGDSDQMGAETDGVQADIER